MRDEELYNALGGERIRDRQKNELIGIVRGICADGAINETEVEFLYDWLTINYAIAESSILGGLYDRVREVLADGKVSKDEAADLLSLLSDMSGPDKETGELARSSTLPLCDPAPQVVFEGRRFCFTGTFGYGSRRDCEGAVEQRRGSCGSLTKKTDFLVIGVYATESWKHSAYGNKVIKACTYRDKGVPISIISEQHWTEHIA